MTGPIITKLSYRDLHVEIRSDGHYFTVYRGLDKPVGTITRPTQMEARKGVLWQFHDTNGRLLTTHRSMNTNNQARRMFDALETKQTPVGSLHASQATTAELIATLDDQSVRLKYRQLCSQAERPGNDPATRQSLADRRDLFKAEAERRNLI